MLSEDEILKAAMEAARKRKRKMEEETAAKNSSGNKTADERGDSFAYGNEEFATFETGAADEEETKNGDEQEKEAKNKKDSDTEDTDEETEEKKREGERIRKDWEEEFEVKKEKMEHERQVREQEKNERRVRIKDLIGIYENLATAGNFEAVFGHSDPALSVKDRLDSVKKVYRKLSIKLHVDKYNMCSSEVKDIAQDAFKLLAIFYEEAQYKIDHMGSVNGKKSTGFSAERSRKYQQSSAYSSMGEKIKAALNAEEEHIKKQIVEENEDYSRWNARMEKEKNEWEEKWQAEYGNENKKQDEEKENEKNESSGAEQESSNNRNEGSEEKEKLIFGLPEKVVVVFNNYAGKVWDSYVEDLSGKNGETGYLDRFGTAEERSQFLSSRIEHHLYEKISEKVAVLIEKYEFSVEDMDQLSQFIIESIKKDKTK